MSPETQPMRAERIAAASAGVDVLWAQLDRRPGDWTVRMRLVEEAVRRDDLAEARRLVRESPDEAPLPPEWQYRLHTLMVHGPAGFALLGEAVSVPPAGDPLSAGPAPAPLAADAPADLTDPAERVPVRPHAGPSEKPGPAAGQPPGHLAGEDLRLAALGAAEGRSDGNFGARPEPAARAGAPAGVTRVDLKARREAEARKREEAEAAFLMEALRERRARGRASRTGQKLSAFSFALLVHLILPFLVGFVVISVPRQSPPQLIATVEVSNEAEVPTPPRVVKQAESKPSAASAATPHVIGALASSPVAIPEMEETRYVDVTAQVTGVAPLGEGLSFTGDAREVSDVNFFGISAGGKRIVFIVDATPEMLVDEKGGMYAYDKVKDEIGIMLAGLNRGTRFNILLYQGSRLAAFAEEPVAAMPSSLRMAIEWLQPLNRDYERLGLAGQEGVDLDLAGDLEPIPARDLAHYGKAIQKAIEWEASAIFCISAGYRPLRRSLSPEEMEAYRKERERNPGTPGTVDPRDREAWNRAQERTREWLRRENAARSEKGLPPKVVINFNQLVAEVTGATPPQATGGTPGAALPRLEPYTPEDIENLVRQGVKRYFRDPGIDPPSLHLVAFLGEDEEMDDQTRDHFMSLTRKNNGKFKLLKGLAALQNVTGKD